MGVQHSYDSPTPNEEHIVDLEVKDIKDLPEQLAAPKKDAEDLSVFLQL